MTSLSQSYQLNKGRCAVVMNTEEYVSKCEDLLHDESTYVKLSRDPTQMYKKEIADQLRGLKETGVLSNNLYLPYHRHCSEILWPP